jgi:hypothetical protein
MANPLALTDGHPFSQVWSQAAHDQDIPPEQSDWVEECAEFDELETWEIWPDPGSLAEPSPMRWSITFVVIALLLTAFSLIAFWGLAGSDWFYGTYGQISQAQWDKIADLRDRLAQLGLAPQAVTALDEALLPPHPSTENVLFDLEKAAQALDQLTTNATARQIQAELHTLIAEIESSYKPGRSPRLVPELRPSPTPTPIMDAPLAQSPDRAPTG